ncbi:glucosaminidase domain-containing protein [Aquibacillus salsiterrae]|uniref:Glucosaminidase domain-containing protein n=1 Tax=Aquibacillus salsiterrae TaxID=2950439 RepID=A0A9X3WFK8_9BACI|nr:glucosaminidase domain-containing protein [Aquibacillus salsiterrae]MDC3416116.1 glucosaminidase domain-containing protein [Aquibacillus salsiterrae]
MRKQILLALLFTMILSIAITQISSTIVSGESDGKSDQQTIKQWDGKFGVAEDKVWTITFNTKMDGASFTNDNVYVINKETGKKHPITYQLKDDGKALTVTPKEPYAFHQTYTLYIGSTVKSAEEMVMSKAIEMSFFISKPYVVADMSYQPINSFDSLREARANVNPDNQVVMKDGKVRWMKSGIVRTNRFTNIYDSELLTSNSTYVAGQSEMEYVGSTERAIAIRVAGRAGFVSPDDVSLIPTKLIGGNQSFYKNINGDLYHYVFANGEFGVYKYGKSPATINEGETVYSWDGKTFKGKTYSFLNQYNLREKSFATAEQIDAYIKAQKPDSPLIGLGNVFVEMQEKYNINALYLMAHAIHESAWGLSKIAKDKNNLYGIKATDSNPYGNADVFNSFEDSVRYAAQFISSTYLTEGNFRYNGTYLGNKASGMNVKYASDPFWGQKIAGQMYRAEMWMKTNNVIDK